MDIQIAHLQRFRKYLTLRDISVCKQVCKHWNKFFSLWRHPRDSSLEFNEELHQYRVLKNHVFTSVTTLIGSFFPKFNPDRAVKCLKGGRKWTPEHKEWGKSDEEIKESWRKNGQEQARLGTTMHAWLEDYFNSCLTRKQPQNFPSEDIIRRDQFIHFIRDHTHLSPYRFEWQIYSEDIKVAGTVDALFWDRNEQTPGQPPRLWLFDWKRSKGIEFYNRYEFGFGPMAGVSHCNFEKYSVQLNMYTWMLERHYGVKIVGMALIVFHPNNSTYLKYDVPRKSELIEKICIST